MRQLTQKERDLIYLLQLQPEVPTTQVEELRGHQMHSVRYHLQRVLSNQIIRPRAFINLNRLGLNQYEIYFTLSSGTKSGRKAIIESLAKSERVSWLGQMGGDFQYGLNIAARGVGEVASLLYELSSRFEVLFVDKVVAERLWFKYFGNKYLSRKKRKRVELAYQLTARPLSIDETDHRILAAVTRLGIRSSRLLARELGLPQTTVDYRLRKLEQSGVVVGYYYELQAALIGMQSFILLVSMKNLRKEQLQRFEHFCRLHPNVVILVHALGSWDFEIGLEAEGAQQVADVVEGFYDEFGPALNWIRVLPAFSNLKVLEYPFQRIETLQPPQDASP